MQGCRHPGKREKEGDHEEASCRAGCRGGHAGCDRGGGRQRDGRRRPRPCARGAARGRRCRQARGRLLQRVSARSGPEARPRRFGVPARAGCASGQWQWDDRNGGRRTRKRVRRDGHVRSSDVRCVQDRARRVVRKAAGNGRDHVPERHRPRQERQRVRDRHDRRRCVARAGERRLCDEVVRVTAPSWRWELQLRVPARRERHRLSPARDRRG